MEQTINLNFDLKYSLRMIILLEVLFLLLLLKSATLGIFFAVFSCALFLLYLYPEFAFAIALTGNIILYWFYEYINITFPFAALLTYIVLCSTATLFIFMKEANGINLNWNKLFTLTFAIGFLMILGIAYSSNKGYGLSKTGLYFVFNISYFVIALLLKNKYRKMNNLFIFAFFIGFTFALICFWIASEFVYFKFVRFSPAESINPIILSRSLGISAICGLYVFVRNRKNIFGILALTLIPITIAPMLWSGSRAPLLGLMITFLLYYLLQPKQGIIRKISVSTFGFLAGLFYILHTSSHISARVSTPVAQEASAAFRVFAWIQAVQDFLGSPITGIGTGSFALNTPWLDLYWPHNLFLEMACENGMIGLGLILFFVILVAIYGFRNIFYYAKTNSNEMLQLSIASSCLFAFSLWNSMFSGDIATNPVVWFSAGLIYALHPTDGKTTANNKMHL
ncbi:hypothetical protein GF337_08300 [candidate division KSB1 bacterium]|nr:hypothetical protein [candidate division KSB1 bacterium]